MTMMLKASYLRNVIDRLYLTRKEVRIIFASIENYVDTKTLVLEYNTKNIKERLIKTA